MLEKKLDLNFKGTRNYIQGPDILNAVLTELDSHEFKVCDIDFAFHRLARNQLKLVYGALPTGVEAVAICSYSSNDLRKRVNIIETQGVIEGRYPYLEDEIVSRMEFDSDAQMGFLKNEIHYSDIEVWVAMTKALHLKMFPNLTGKWLFVRARFPKFIFQSRCKERKIQLVASFNDKLTKSDALLDGNKVGEIYFSIV